MKYLASLLTGILFFCVASGIFAQQAVITELFGTVELKFSGSASWVNARQGQILAEDTIVSTGFKSSALIQAGSSVITVRPLTRLTLSELRSAAGTESINVNLQTGRVRVEINPPAGMRANMEVRGPMATASVRGTAFEFDTLNLAVHEGTVVFTGSVVGVSVLIDAGRSSFADEQNGRAALPIETAIAELRPPQPITSWSVSASEALNAAEIPGGVTTENTIGLSTIITY